MARRSLDAGAMASSSSGFAPMSVVAAGAMALLQRIADNLDTLASPDESEPDFDVTYVVGGLITVPTAVQIQIPRTIHHVELTLNIDMSGNSAATAPCSVAVLDGNLLLSDAQRRHQTGGGAGSSGGIISQSSGRVTARDYLAGTGYLTVYFSASAAVTQFANVRVRSLDKLQARQLRT